MSTRDTLTDLGEAAIRRSGYGGFSYADLAREAGIKKASIHHHFPVKADLGLAVLERYAGRLEETLQSVSDTSETGQEALVRAVDVYREALGDGSRMCLCAALSGDGERLDEAMHDRLAATNRMVVQWLENTLARGARDGSLKDQAGKANSAQATLALLQGAQLVARAARDVSLFDAATQEIAH